MTDQREPGERAQAHQLSSQNVSGVPGRTQWKRLLWLLGVFAVQMLYFPINRTMHGGVILRTPLDDYIPLWPIWAVPYLLSLVWWEGAFVWAAIRMEGDRFRALAIATLAVMLTSYALYLVYPTYVERPTVQGSGWAADLVRAIYRNDRLHNAFPSGHTYFTTLIALFWWDWKPRLRWLWAATVAIVILATLFTGQHHLPDPLGGLLWAWLGYRFGIWWIARRSRG